MLLYVVIAFGLIVVWRLAGISQQLETNRLAMRNLERIGERIEEEFQWHKDSTFAHQLSEWLQEISEDITGEIQTAAKDILGTLATIEDNTSRD